MEEGFLDDICLDREMKEGFLDDICLLASQMYEETQRNFLDDDFTSSDGFQQEPARIANSVEPKQPTVCKVEENKENVKPETSSTPVFNFAGCSVTFNY